MDAITALSNTSGESDPTSRSTAGGAFVRHARLRDAFGLTAQRYERLGNRLSWARFGTFFFSAVWAAAAWAERSAATGWFAGLLFALFVGAVAKHSRVVRAQADASCRRDIHDRHMARIGTDWMSFESKGETLIPRDHEYAWDIDVVGQGSLFQRIDATHTRHGERLLADWLASPASGQVVLERQAAVVELRDRLEFRREFEAAALMYQPEKLNPRGIEALGKVALIFPARPWLLAVARGLPLVTAGLLTAQGVGWLPSSLWLIPLALQVAVLMYFGRKIRATLDLVEARSPTLEAYKELLLLIERIPHQSALLCAIKERIALGSQAPSDHFARLAFWIGLGDLRHNFLVHVVVDAFTLWDLHVLYGVERFIKEAGSRAGEWFNAIGEVEALASLATLADCDPDATLPEIADENAQMRAVNIAHPLLLSSERVANDVALRGPGTALIVTGSNMAGKSTLLRAVGLNLALALAGGPVIARSMRVPRVRLRSSMRADDSLERGASYFQSELIKIKRVITDAESSPPVFFLLDELLRGTNARARHLGSKAVLLHLLNRHATGIYATHDVDLAAFGQTDPDRIENVHFTDVMMEGEMRFDYHLRPGIVRSSNALRLLAMAGVDVPDDSRNS
jgi:hypothetical protein